MPGRYAVLVSYSHHCEQWVKVLHANLELYLGDRVFLDQLEITSGRSWAAGLQSGIDRTELLVLVVTASQARLPKKASGTTPVALEASAASGGVMRRPSSPRSAGYPSRRCGFWEKLQKGHR